MKELIIYRVDEGERKFRMSYFNVITSLHFKHSFNYLENSDIGEYLSLKHVIKIIGESASLIKN